MPILADAHISSLGYQCGHKKKRACEKEKRVSPSGTLQALLQAPATQATEMQSVAFLDTILWNVTDCAPTSSRLDNFSDIVNYIM